MTYEKKLPPEELIPQLEEDIKNIEKEILAKEKSRREKIIVKGQEDKLKKEINTLMQHKEKIKKQIRETQEELRERRKWKEKVPIEEAAKEDLEGLSDEGRQVITVLRGVKEKKKIEESVKETSSQMRTAKKETALEEAISRERIEPPSETRGMEYGHQQPGAEMAYGMHSQKPLAELYQEATALKKSIEEKGYVSPTDQRRAEYFTAAVQERMQAVEEGTYSLSEQAARAASLTQMIGQNIQQSYRGKKKNEWYQ